MTNKRYFNLLALLLIVLAAIGLAFDLNVRYWIVAGGGIVLYVWCKDVFTGNGWLHKPALPQSNPGMAEAEYQADVATYNPVSETERNGYIELVHCCVAEATQAPLIYFFRTLKEYSNDADYGTTLNYVLAHLDDNSIPFIMALDWKADIETLEWRLQSSIKNNFNTFVELPQPDAYDKKAAVSFDGVLADFDRPLRKIGLQLGFIDTQSDEYVIVVHRVADRHNAEAAVEKIGYRYYQL